MIVAKFGGSSLASATQFAKVKKIVSSNPDIQVVVVSAPGKRCSGDIKITDYLYTLRSHYKYSVPEDKIEGEIMNRYKEISDDLKLGYKIEDEIKAFFDSCNKNTDTNRIVSRGEYFSARLMAETLGFEFVDAADVLHFTFDGELDEEASATAVREAVETYGRIVVPGFYGSYPNGDIHLFSRGGSDITGSYIAAFLGADVYENWTDVSGVYKADPRIVKDAEVVESITYEELREMSYMGADVLHQNSVRPCQTHNIPIHIKNTNDPTAPGTYIVEEAKQERPVTGLACKKGFVNFFIYKRHMANQIGFIYDVLEIFKRYNVSVEHIPTGMDNITVVVQEANVSKCIHKILSDLKEELDCEVDFEKNMSLLAVVGLNMIGYIGLSAKVLGILASENINVKMIVQSPDEMNMMVGLETSDADQALAALYKGLHEQNLL